MDEGVRGGLLGKEDGASENSTALALRVLDTEFLPRHVSEPWTFSPPELLGHSWAPGP